MAFEQVHPAPTVPPRDSAIDQAIADVDDRLAEWHNAMRRAQAVVRAHTARQSRAVSGHDGYRSPSSHPESAGRQAGGAAADAAQVCIAESAARHAAEKTETLGAAEPRSAPQQLDPAAAVGGSNDGIAIGQGAESFESAFQADDENREIGADASAASNSSSGAQPQAAVPDLTAAAPVPDATTEPDAAAEPAPLPVDDEQPPGGEAPPAEDEEEALLATLDSQTREAVELKRRWVGPNRSLKDLVEEARRASPAQMAQIRRWRSRS